MANSTPMSRSNASSSNPAIGFEHDAASFYQSIAFGGHQMRTLFDGVFQVPPGHYVIATEKHLQVIQYWDFNFPASMLPRHRAPTRTGRLNFGLCWRRPFAFACAPMSRSIWRIISPMPYIRQKPYAPMRMAWRSIS